MLKLTVKEVEDPTIFDDLINVTFDRTPALSVGKGFKLLIDSIFFPSEVSI